VLFKVIISSRYLHLLLNKEICLYMDFY